MWDWNNNGRYDEEDRFIDYQIFTELSEDRSNTDSDSGCGGFMTLVGGGLLVFGILLILAMMLG